MRTMTDKTYRALRRLVKELKLCIGCYNDSGESCGKCVQCLKTKGGNTAEMMSWGEDLWKKAGYQPRKHRRLKK